MENYLEKKVGNIDKPKNALEPKVVTILGSILQDKTKDDKPMKVPLVNLMVKHPDKEDPVKISKIKSLIKDKVVVRTLWLVTDEKENIQKDSAVADIIKHFKVESLKELEGKVVDTVEESDESSFLCIKMF